MSSLASFGRQPSNARSNATGTPDMSRTASRAGSKSNISKSSVGSSSRPTTVQSTPPSMPFALSPVHTLDDGAVCLVGLAPATGATSEPFEVSGKRFQLRLGVRNTVTMKLQSLDAAPKADVYVQCRHGLISFTTAKSVSQLLHCLFTNPAPWGRTSVICSAEELNNESNGYVALRGVDAEHLARCVRVEVVMKVLHKGPMGEYTIRRLPVVSHPAPAAELKDALEDGSWTYRTASVEVAEAEEGAESKGAEESKPEEGKSAEARKDLALRVTVPAWRYHNVVWSKGIPVTGEPRIWEAQVKVTHAAADTFGSMRVGLIPLDRYVYDGMDILDVSASINQEGTCFVTGSAIVKGPCIAGNVAVITVRVDMSKRTVCWKVRGAGEEDEETATECIPLSKELLRSDLHPFVSLNYRGDTVTWLRGGVVPGEDEQMALDVKRSAQEIFLFCDRNDSGALEGEEAGFLAERTQRNVLRKLEGMTLEQVVEWYEANGHALSDGKACKLRRVDPSDGELKHKEAFADPQQWAQAEEEVLPEVEPMRKKFPTAPPAEGEEPPEPQYKTRAEFKEAGISDEQWFAAEVEPEPEPEPEPELENDGAEAANNEPGEALEEAGEEGK